MRSGEISRATAETRIQLKLTLNGKGVFAGSSTMGFFDHMLTLFCRHGAVDLELQASGDLQVDTHHLVEDLGICMGQAIRSAVGNAAGIRRYGSMRLPMDEVLTCVDLDLSGRGYLVCNVHLDREKVGDFETEMLREFLYALAIHGGMNLHVNTLYGENNHHILESVFKALGRALREAVQIIDESGAIPSTKGVL